MRKLAERDTNIHLEPGDTILVSYTGNWPGGGLVLEREIIRATVDRAMCVNYLSVVELDESELAAIGLGELKSAISAIVAEKKS